MKKIILVPFTERSIRSLTCHFGVKCYLIVIRSQKKSSDWWMTFENEIKLAFSGYRWYSCVAYDIVQCWCDLLLFTQWNYCMQMPMFTNCDHSIIFDAADAQWSTWAHGILKESSWWEIWREREREFFPWLILLPKLPITTNSLYCSPSKKLDKYCHIVMHT